MTILTCPACRLQLPAHVTVSGAWTAVRTCPRCKAPLTPPRDPRQCHVIRPVARPA